MSSLRRPDSRRHGFTLVELLVVITIIGMLSYMLLPAVQSVRETARQVVCKNNLSQIGKAVLGHVQAAGQYPTGGWGWSWAGDPDLGFNTNQHGGWVFNILPFLDQQSLYRLGAGASYNPGIGGKVSFAAQRLTVPVDTFYCPSRRRAIAYPFNQRAIYDVAVAMRTDYAINGGHQGGGRCQGGQTQRLVGALPAGAAGSGGPNPPMTLVGLGIGLDVTFQRMPTGQVGTNLPALTGVSFVLSQVRESELDADGSHNVYLVGEKGVCSNHYEDGYDGGDNENAYTGWNNDVFRTAQVAPRQDHDERKNGGNCTSGTFNGNSTGPCAWGSPHAGYMHMVFCDGSVRAVHYDIDVNLHKRLANRHDGAEVDLSQL